MNRTKRVCGRCPWWVAELVRKMAERDLQQKFQLLQERLDQYVSGKEELNECAGDEMNRRILKAANDVFAASIPTIMKGVQAHVDTCLDARVFTLVAQLDAQKTQLASLAARVAAYRATSKSKTKT